jgi:para-aminobenzoate synthetase
VPISPATRWSVHGLDRALDGPAVFRELFADDPVAFWLDSSMAVPGLSRLSVLGTSAGPDAETLVDRVGDGDVFTRLRDRLAARSSSGTPPIGLPFTGGYVGWFGYELKALTGGAVAHTSPTPDALWIWANRYVVIDPEHDRTWFVSVHPADDDGTAAGWPDRAAAALERRPMESAAIAVPEVAKLEMEPLLEQSREEYLAAIARCRAALEAGETYEVCLTNRVRLPAVPDPLAFYLWQRRRNPAPYAAFLRYHDLAVASSSPERFLTVDTDRWAECRPIKGTAPRSDDPVIDRAAAERLATDAKTRAENLMIVDLIRNDLGRVCEPGTVQVPRLMTVESYATVHQLVTTVRGRLRTDVDVLDAVRACFPPGSMTGAPKIRTMEILDSLELSARGIYSGALGYLGLDGHADLSVVIRTAVMTPTETVVGAGGAIVLDSVAEDEYDEMLLKATAAVRGQDG